MNDFFKNEICKELQVGIEELGFECPMPIQEKVIPLIIENDEDLIGLAQTGTGKTAAWGLPLIQKLNKGGKEVQVLVLSPTRELCIQIAQDLTNYAKYMKWVGVVSVYGGASIENQIRELKKMPQIIVATPGRLLDLINRKKVDITTIKALVLDEADEMLNMGFKEELTAIIEKTPDSRSTYLFSATMSREVAKIAVNYMHSPIEIIIGKRNAGAENVRHIYHLLQERNRYQALKRIVDYYPNIYGIIFCRTRLETKDIAARLIQDGYNSDALHGDLSQAQRENVMQKFRQKNLQMIVATDVAARGLDVEDLTHIIHYNIPDEIQNYTHRSGRTGRAGKKGISIALINLKEKYKIKQIEKMSDSKFNRLPIPDSRTICEKQLFHLINKMEHVEVADSQIDPYLEVIYKKLEWLSKEQIIKQFVALEFNRFLSYYENAPDLNAPLKEDRHKKSQKPEKKKKLTRSEVIRFFINVGKRDDLTPPKMIGLINDCTGIRNIIIGRIEIMSGFAFFEVEKGYQEMILQSFQGATFNNQELRVDLATPRTPKLPSRVV